MTTPVYQLTFATPELLDAAVQHLLAPAAELVVDALPHEVPAGPVLCLEHDEALLAHAVYALSGLRGRPSVSFCTSARRGAQGPRPPRQVRGVSQALPFRDRSIALALANLVLGQGDHDSELLEELQRLLVPGGALVATALAQGTFEEFFDVADEVCEREGRTDARAFLADTRTALLRPERLHGLCEAAGLRQIKVACCDRALPFDGGETFMQDPLVRQVFMGGWLKTFKGQRERLAVSTAVADAIDTYFRGLGFTVRLCTLLVTASA